VGGLTQFPIDPFQQLDNPLLGQLVSRITFLEQEIERLHAVEGLGHVGFSVFMNANQSNVAVNTNITVQFDREKFDIGNNFNLVTHTFTAPINGKYLLTTLLRFDGVDTAGTSIQLAIITSNGAYTTLWPSSGFALDVSYVVLNVCAIADMDALDTAFVQARVNGGAVQTDLMAGNYSRFMGWLIG
jgi:hypothetical protein